jgi:hypothetical protein
MARYILTEGWFVGSFLIPAGTILDSSDWQWNQMPLPASLPISVAALDQDAYDELLRQYPYFAYRILTSGENITRTGDPVGATSV